MARSSQSGAPATTVVPQRVLNRLRLQRVGVWLLGLPLTAGLFTLAVDEYRAKHRLERDGRPTVATVVAIEKGYRSGPAYRVQYTVEDGRSLQSYLYSGSGRLGAQLDARYDPHEPTTVAVGTLSPFWLVWVGFGGLSAGLFVGVGVGAGRWQRRLVAAAAGPSTTTAVLVDIVTVAAGMGERGRRVALIRDADASGPLPASGEPLRVLWLDSAAHRLVPAQVPAQMRGKSDGDWRPATLQTFDRDPDVATLKLANGNVLWPAKPLRRYRHRWQFDGEQTIIPDRP